MSDAINHAFFNGLSSSGLSTTALPVQTLLEHQKNTAWKQRTLDRLEQIAERQFLKNIELNDYYKMIRGEMVYSDYMLSDVTNEVLDLREKAGIPIHAKHYDFLGIIVNQIKGEYPSHRDRYRIETIDEVSQNEFIRTKTDEARNYTQRLFNLELEQKLLQRGIVLDPNKEFQSEEERQDYIQEIEQQKASIIAPEHIERELNKSFKTNAALWAEKTLEFDWLRDDFDLESQSLQEIEDYLLTGRWFRHYHIGYDYYKPERWHPCQVFFSEDLDAKYPQEGEYIGRIHWMSPSDIINRYGSKITEDVQRRLMGFFNEGKNDVTSIQPNNSLKSIVEGNFGETQTIPFEGWYDYDLTLQLQDVFQTPFGETTIVEDGQEKKVPAWFSPINNGTGFLNANYAQVLRSDIDIRTDLLQTVETYWRSYKRVGVLNYITPDGFLDQVFVTDKLLPEFLKENEITTLRKVTLEEAEQNPEPNTIAYTWIPEVRWGVKVKAGNSYLLKDLYIGGDALDFQIKGASNVYDVQLPVAGFIGDSTAKKLRPYIIKHNIVLNQIYSLLEKELGTFFLFDVHYLPSEYKNNDSTRESLEQMYELIQDLGIVPIDTSKQNMQGNQPAMNAFMTQSLDFTNQITNRINLANTFKLQALEQIGITPQRMGSPNEYSTAEGIKQGMTASYAQTDPIYNVMSTSSRKANLLHLNVAQYCQKNYKDYSFLYTKPDGVKTFIELSDVNFPLRNFNLVAVASSKERKELETLRSALMQNNTIGGDIQAMAEIFASDTIASLVDVGRQMRLKAEKDNQVQMEHEQNLLDKQLAMQAEEKQKDREWTEASKKRDRETQLERERINALGRASDKQSDTEGFEQINKATQDALNNEYKQADLDNKVRTTDIKERQADVATQIELQKINLQLQDIKLKREKIQADKFIALANKN